MGTTTTSNLCAAQLESVAIVFLRLPWLVRLWVALLALCNIVGVFLFQEGSVEV